MLSSNNKLIEEYGESKQTNNTRKSYKSDINQFVKFVKKDLSEVELVDVNKYFRAIEKKKSNATLNRYIRSLYDFYDYLIYNETYRKNNPLGRMKSYKIDNSVVKTKEITIEQFQELITVIKKKIEVSNTEFQKTMHSRNLAIIMLDANGGFRISELLNLTFDNIDFDNHKIILMDSETKGKKKRAINFDENVFGYLKDYLEVRDVLLKDNKSNYVFLSRSGNAMDYTSYDKALKEYGKDIDMPDLSSHSFRILYVVNTYNATNHDLVKTQMLVGHANINQTRAYTKLKLNEDELIVLPTAGL